MGRGAGLHCILGSSPHSVQISAPSTMSPCTRESMLAAVPPVSLTSPRMAGRVLDVDQAAQFHLSQLGLGWGGAAVLPFIF